MAIFKAAKAGNLASVRQCVSKGVDINEVNSVGQTALYIASRHNNVNVVEYLLQRNADTEVREKENQWTALITASRNNCRDVVKVLLQHGSDVNVQGKDGHTPLWIAAFEGHQDVVQVLLQHKAFVDSRTYGNQETPLYVAGYNGHVDVVCMLIKAGANLESRQMSCGWTPLMTASWNNHSNVVDVLCQAGADINARDNSGYTALYLAASKNATNVVRTLLKYFPTLSENKDGKTPLDTAKSKGHADIVTAIEDYIKSQQDKPPTGSVPRRTDRPQSGMRQYASTLQAELKEKKDKINKQRESDSRYDRRVEDIERQFKTLLKRIDEVETNQSVSAKQEATTDVEKDMWDTVRRISEEVDTLPEPKERKKNLGNKHLYHFSKKLGSKWKELGASLGIDLHEIEKIQMENPNNTTYSTWAMLVQWRDAQSGTVDDKKAELLEAVEGIERMDLKGYI